MHKEGELSSEKYPSRCLLTEACVSLSYIPLIAPATSLARLKLLCKIADSFIYVVSRMGVTGATGVLNSALPELLERVHKESGNIPTVVGFGISTREHFLGVGKIADGAVVGSQIVQILAESPAGHGAKSVQDFCSQLTGRKGLLNETTKASKATDEEKEPTNSVPVSEFVRGETGSGQLKALNMGGGAYSSVSVKWPILA